MFFHGEPPSRLSWHCWIYKYEQREPEERHAQNHQQISSSISKASDPLHLWLIMSNVSPKIIGSFEEEEMEDAKWSQLNPAWKDENEAEEPALDYLATVTSPASNEASYQPPVTRSNFNNMAPTNDSKIICRPFFCQRCFLRMQYHQDHVCEIIHKHKACQWCAKVHQRCIPV